MENQSAHICTYMYIYVHMYSYMYSYMYILICTYILIHTYLYVHTYMYILTYLYVLIYVHICPLHIVRGAYWLNLHKNLNKEFSTVISKKSPRAPKPTKKVLISLSGTCCIVLLE